MLIRYIPTKGDNMNTEVQKTMTAYDQVKNYVSNPKSGLLLISPAELKINTSLEVARGTGLQCHITVPIILATKKDQLMLEDFNEMIKSLRNHYARTEHPKGLISVLKEIYQDNAKMGIDPRYWSDSLTLGYLRIKEELGEFENKSNQVSDLEMITGTCFKITPNETYQKVEMKIDMNSKASENQFKDVKGAIPVICSYVVVIYPNEASTRDLAFALGDGKYLDLVTGADLQSKQIKKEAIDKYRALVKSIKRR